MKVPLKNISVSFFEDHGFNTSSFDIVRPSGPLQTIGFLLH